MPALVLLTEGKETRFDLGNRPVVGGRSVECDIQLSENRASRQHFQVEPTDRGWVVRDLDSSNGTAVNGYAVSRALLSNGDLIEVGGVALRFDAADGPSPTTSRTPRPPRKSPSSAPAWMAAAIAFLAVAVSTDVVAMETAETRDRKVRESNDEAAHLEFLVATREPDPDRAEKAFEEYVRAHPQGADASQARSRHQALQGSRETRRAASAEFDALSAEAPGLSAPEYRWRLEELVRRWADSPDAMTEVRRRASPGRGPAAPSEDSRILFQRRKREADAALAEGDCGRSLTLWNAHAVESPPQDPGAESDLRAEVRRVEEAAAKRAREVLDRVASLRDEGKADEGLKLLRAAIPSLGETGGGRRLAARLEAGLGFAGGKGASAADQAGFARLRPFYERARIAEQFVVLRDYRGAADLYASIAADAKEFADVSGEMRVRSESLRGVVRLLDEVRAAPGAWKGKPWPDTWDAVPPAELFPFLQRAVKKPEDRLALATFAYDQMPLKQAHEAVVAALENPATHGEAERLYSAREGVPIPEGGFVVEKGEILSRAEWNRRRNAAAIAELRKREASLVKRLHESQVVRGIDRMREKRAELDRARAHALDLIFDEVTYFYPYRDRMGEYTQVQQDVDKRVEAVRDLWDDKARFHSKSDAGASQVLKDYDAALKQLRDLGAEPSPLEKEVEDLRMYFDRDLDIRTFFLNAEEMALFEYDRGVMKENPKRRAVADESEARQVEVTNEYRIMFGRRAVLIADKLVLAARAHCDDMMRGGFFGHFNERLLGMKPGEKVPKQACGCSSDGLLPGCSHGPDARIRAQGYEFIACSENIHAGSGDPESAHRGWIHSSGHHRNILTTAWKEMGSGRAGRDWAQNFGLPPGAEEAASDGAGSNPWDRAGGRGTGEDGNPPAGK